MVEVGPMTEPDYWDSEFSDEYLNRETNLGDILLIPKERLRSPK